MTNDKTVTMSRELAERMQAFLDDAFDGRLEGILQEDCGSLISELRANLAAPVVERQEPMALSIPEECPHLIVFDDTDRENMLFAGTGARSAALKTWGKISMSWNAHLFVRVERNSRDDRYPSASTSPPAPVAVVLPDAAYDKVYRNGLMQGYNLALNGSEQEYQDAVTRFSKNEE